MKRVILIVAVVIVLIVARSSIFIIDPRQQALVLQFGQVKQVATDPGLYFKIPLIQEVVRYEKRILPLETSELEVTPLDERRLVVDAFARWRITNVVKFREAVQFEASARRRLQSILNASLREVLGKVRSADVLSTKRTGLMVRIRDSARERAVALGVEVVDVRIRRADLPQQNLAATFTRMNAERKREARDERARGKERALELQATADRQAIELVSDAQRQSEIVRGAADAERNKIFAKAFGLDTEFFAFYRSLRAYERALKGSNSTLVISPDSEFFEYLKSNRVSPGGAADRRNKASDARAAAKAAAAAAGNPANGKAAPAKDATPAPDAGNKAGTAAPAAPTDPKPGTGGD